MVGHLLSDAGPSVGGTVHPEGCTRTHTKPGRRTPVLSVPAPDGVPACDPHISRTAPPYNGESVRRRDRNERPRPRTTDAPDHALTIARPKRDRTEPNNSRSSGDYAEDGHPL